MLCVYFMLWCDDDNGADEYVVSALVYLFVFMFVYCMCLCVFSFLFVVKSS